jgi:anti-sigma B factor antagonist
MSATDHISISGDQAFMRPFCVDVTPERDVVRVCPRGDIDLATVGAVRERVDELTGAGFRRVVLDLRGVTFLDASGLHLLVELDASSHADGWSLTITEGRSDVQRPFEVTGLRSRLPFAGVAQNGHRSWRRTWR